MIIGLAVFILAMFSSAAENEDTIRSWCVLDTGESRNVSMDFGRPIECRNPNEQTVIQLAWVAAPLAAEELKRFFADDANIVISTRQNVKAIFLTADRETTTRARRLLKRIDVEICDRQVGLEKASNLTKLKIVVALKSFAVLVGSLAGQSRSELRTEWSPNSMLLIGGPRQIRGALQIILWFEPHAVVFSSPSHIDSVGPVHRWKK